MRLAVRLTPRGGRDGVDGWALDAGGRPYLKVRVSSPPVEGEANAALIAVLAKALGRPKSSLRIAAGTAARLKSVEIDGLEAADLAAAFGPPPGA
ncbi:MAG: hypothetical protein JWP92_703 [Caulobacter sp.]|nr:hypothetical protein [Caulobacter sp.]